MNKARILHDVDTNTFVIDVLFPNGKWYVEHYDFQTYQEALEYVELNNYTIYED